MFHLHVECHAATRLHPDLPLRSTAQSALLMPHLSTRKTVTWLKIYI